MTSGYRLAYLESEAQVRAVAGYRFSENLAWGRFCYVDDLVTDAGNRSKAYGRALFEWLVARAEEGGASNSTWIPESSVSTPTDSTWLAG